MQKHGIDFESAKMLWKDPNRVEIPSRWVDEPRYILIARLGNNLWSAIYTLRENRIRLISVRKSRSNEKEIYDSIGIWRTIWCGWRSFPPLWSRQCHQTRIGATTCQCWLSGMDGSQVGCDCPSVGSHPPECYQSIYLWEAERGKPITGFWVACQLPESKFSNKYVCQTIYFCVNFYGLPEIFTMFYLCGYRDLSRDFNTRTESIPENKPKEGLFPFFPIKLHIISIAQEKYQIRQVWATSNLYCQFWDSTSSGNQAFP